MRHPFSSPIHNRKPPRFDSASFRCVATECHQCYTLPVGVGQCWIPLRHPCAEMRATARWGTVHRERLFSSNWHHYSRCTPAGAHPHLCQISSQVRPLATKTDVWLFLHSPSLAGTTAQWWWQTKFQTSSGPTSMPKSARRHTRVASDADSAAAMRISGRDSGRRARLQPWG